MPVFFTITLSPCLTLLIVAALVQPVWSDAPDPPAEMASDSLAAVNLSTRQPVVNPDTTALAEKVCDPAPTNLWGLEGQRFFRSAFCPSPDGRWVAYTEMVFVPALRQTTATLFILPVLETPHPSPAQPPPRTWWETHLWDPLEARIYPQWFPKPPPVDYPERNQNPDFRTKQAIPLLKLTFQPPFEFSTLQVAYWRGNQLWVEQKTGRLHIGWQTQRRWHLDLDRLIIHPGSPNSFM